MLYNFFYNNFVVQEFCAIYMYKSICRRPWIINWPSPDWESPVQYLLLAFSVTIRLDRFSDKLVFYNLITLNLLHKIVTKIAYEFDGKINGIGLKYVSNWSEILHYLFLVKRTVFICKINEVFLEKKPFYLRSKYFYKKCMSCFFVKKTFLCIVLCICRAHDDDRLIIIIVFFMQATQRKKVH